MSREFLFVTHADVVISADVPVPDWPLTARGRARHRAHAETLKACPPVQLWASFERKTRDAAAIVSEVLDIPVRHDHRLGENDRSATGFLAFEDFERAADAFFASPDTSFRGWETARAAQARIVGAVGEIADAAADGMIMILAHGGVGALLLAHLMGRPISRRMDQPGRFGGNAFRFRWPGPQMIHGWQDIAPNWHDTPIR